ncbi:MAG: tetratricopeptide repeat protein [Rhodanobacteraceae bacterium]
MRAASFVVVCALASLGSLRIANAAPHRPASDGEIVETLPAGARQSDRAARALRAATARDPGNLDLALRLASLDIARARLDSDPRPLGRAQATLAPWWDAADAPVPVLVLRATIEQSGHAFDAAAANLERALARDPANAQAWLTLASVRQVTGDLDGAIESCRRLGEVASPALAHTCEAAVEAVSGKAAAAYDSLDRARTAFARDTSLLVWATTLQAESAERLGRSDDAERHYRESLVLDPRDVYTTAAYADFLLDAARDSDVLAMIPRDTPVDILLLRRVLAARRSGAPDARVEADELAQRFDALRARGDRVHLREEARFTLEVLGRPDDALALALDNWRVQKEPLDARIALETALAAARPEAVREIVGWLERTHLEGERIASLAAAVR